MPSNTRSVSKPVLPAKKKEKTSGVRPLKENGQSGKSPFLGGIRLEESITIGKSAKELYAFWRDFTNFPVFCKGLREVEILDDNRSRWTADGPGGKALTWDASIVEDRPSELISWRSFEGADFTNAGSVRFVKAPADRGTEVHLTFAYNPPAGALGSFIAKLTGKEPAFLVKEQIRRLKQLMETGEIATTDGQAAVINK